MISREISNLSSEKYQVEAEVAQKEAQFKVKTSEVNSLQSEYDTLAATLKQLDNQKGEAMKRLTDLDNQKESLEKDLEDLKLKLDEELEKVENLRRQAEEQEKTLKAQEEEVSSKQKELDDLQEEERKLEQQISQAAKETERLNNKSQNTQLMISQAKAKMSNTEEQERQMNDALTLYDSVLATGDVSTVTDSSLRVINPEFQDPDFMHFSIANGGSPVEEEDLGVADPFEGSDTTFAAHEPAKDDFFAHNDPFLSSAASSRSKSADPFAPSDGFANQGFGTQDDFFKNDPFAPFAGSNAQSHDPFSSTAGGDSHLSADFSKDPFGSDPFAPATSPSGPPRRPESPCPALPPKAGKKPPPRPAPPKNAPARPPGPTRAAPAPPNPGGKNNGGGEFANFDNFESKFARSTSTSDSLWGDFDPFAATPNKKTTTTTSISAINNPKNNNKLDFDEDPFQNYRYDYPLDISQDCPDPFDGPGTDPFGDDTTDDPFANGITLPRNNHKSAMNNNNNNDPFETINTSAFKHISLQKDIINANANFVDAWPEKSVSPNNYQPLGNKSVTSNLTEEAALKWAATESIRLEDERKRRQNEQEEADLQYALALSRAEAESDHRASKA